MCRCLPVLFCSTSLSLHVMCLDFLLLNWFQQLRPHHLHLCLSVACVFKTCVQWLSHLTVRPSRPSSSLSGFGFIWSWLASSAAESCPLFIILGWNISANARKFKTVWKFIEKMQMFQRLNQMSQNVSQSKTQFFTSCNADFPHPESQSCEMNHTCWSCERQSLSKLTFSLTLPEPGRCSFESLLI